eukprot:CAMPEP_0204873458 /NCGR_PEP_ID=MMETSP1348-20121228/40698_1 /ASSEMBLY_ACC=CAM_ASM_000700 /TAXON_ID=215587 /ORGANISM="Aplanochytrium stocchinoi, Strain GSBS06" /LENGTH=698 /DNA_ID=CAMNT_0052028813 /DNA_START=36 /DNA_END=2132 /DNA_ORIENTATION=+
MSRISWFNSGGGSLYLVNPKTSTVNQLDTLGNVLDELQHDLLSDPVDVCLSCKKERKQEIFVLDAASKAIIVFQAIFSTGVEEDEQHSYVRTFTGPFKNPTSITCTTERLLVLDSGDIHVFTFRGVFIRTFFCESEPQGEETKSIDNYSGCISACEEYGQIAVADIRKNKIHVYDLDGNFLRSWGRFGKRTGEFNQPNGLAYDSSSELIIIADTGNCRLQAFDVRNLGTLVWTLEMDPNFKPWDVAAPGRNSNNTDFIYVSDESRLKRVSKTGLSFRSPPDEEESDEDSITSDSVSFLSEKLDKTDPKNRLDRKLGEGHTEEMADGELSSCEDDENLSKQVNQSHSSTRLNKKNSLDKTSRAKNSSGNVRSDKDTRSLQDELKDLCFEEENLQEQVKMMIREETVLKTELSTLEGLARENQAHFAVANLPAHLYDSDLQQAIVNTLNTADAVHSCTDALALEEKLIELGILENNMRISLPNLEESLTREKSQIYKLEQKYENLMESFQDIPRRDRIGDDDIREELVQIRAKQRELEGKIAQIKANHKSIMMEGSAKKQDLYKSLDSIKELLETGRQNARDWEMRQAEMESKKQSLQILLRDLEIKAKAAGIKDKTVSFRKVFNKYDVDNSGTLSADELVQAFLDLQKLAPQPAASKILPHLTKETVREYILLGDSDLNKQGLLDFEGFVAAFNELTTT